MKFVRSEIDHDLMASIWEKAISMLVGNLNSNRSLILLLLYSFQRKFFRLDHFPWKQSWIIRRIYTANKNQTKILTFSHIFLCLYLNQTVLTDLSERLKKGSISIPLLILIWELMIMSLIITCSLCKNQSHSNKVLR